MEVESRPEMAEKGRGSPGRGERKRAEEVSLARAFQALAGSKTKKGMGDLAPYYWLQETCGAALEKS